MSTYSNSLLKLTILILISISSSTLVTGDTNLIQKTCKTTKFYDLCVSALESDTTSPTADTKGLAMIMVQVGVLNATATNTFLSHKLSNISTTKSSRTSSINALTIRVLTECAQKYAFASKALHDSLQDLDAESYDYAYLNVMAAADYPNACHNAYKRYQGKLTYPVDLASREEGFKNICDVVMGIIDTLASS